MKRLPADAVPYQRTKTFDESSLPQALRNAHRTKPGVWGRIHVREGTLRYEILGPETESHVLRPGVTGVIEPEVLHRVEPLGPVRFFVEFLRPESESGKG